MGRLLRSVGVCCVALALVAALWPSLVHADSPPPSITVLKRRLWAGEVPATASRAPLQEACTASAADAGMVSWTRLAFESFRDGNWEIYWSQGDGSQPVRLTNHPAMDLYPRLNRGADRVVFASDRDGSSELYAVNIDGSGLTRLTYNASSESYPVWSPDSRRIAFATNRAGSWDIYVMLADGSAASPITWGMYDDVQPTWSPDGSKIAWVQRRDEDTGALCVASAAGGDPGHCVTEPLLYLQHPVWSPDGGSIAVDYDCDSDYFNEVVLFNTDGSNRRVRVDNTPGGNWRPLQDVWMGAFSPRTSQLVVTVLYFAIQGDYIVLTRTSLEQTEGNPVSSSDTDMMPDWQLADIAPPWVSFAPMPRYLRAPTGHFPVSWQGTDIGLSGLKSFDIQVRDQTDADWRQWLQNTTDTSAVHHGGLGWTYVFRVRACDNADNCSNWKLSRTDGTTLYAWESSGQVGDIRDVPVPNAVVSLTPQALTGGAVDWWGRYKFYGISAGEHELRAAHTGYGPSPTIWLNPSAGQDMTGVNLHLPPTDEVVSDGGFERGDLSAWQMQGTITPTLGTIRQSGRYGLLLGQTLSLRLYSLPGSPVLPFPARLLVDTQGNLDVFHSTSAGAYHLTKPVGGSWSGAILLADSGQWVSPARDANGTLHTVGHQHVHADVQYALVHKYRLPSGEWSPAARIPAALVGSQSIPTALTDSRGNLHVLWDCSDCAGGGAGPIYHTIRSADGLWSSPSTLPAQPTNLNPRNLAVLVTADDALHALWLEGNYSQSGGDSLRLVYSRRPRDGVWTAPQVLAVSAGNLVLREWPVLVGDGAGGLHVLWLVRTLKADGSSERQDAYCRHSSDGGLTWSAATSITAWDGYLHPGGEAPAVAADAQAHLHAVWQYPDGGSAQGTYYSVSLDGGVTWSRPLGIGAEIRCPTAAVDSTGNRLYVAGAAVIGELLDVQETTADCGVSQQVTIAQGMQQPTLSFAYRQDRGATPAGDQFAALLNGQPAWTAPITATGWSRAWVDLQPWHGLTVNLSFDLHSVPDGDRTWVYLDDVSVGSWLTPVIDEVSPSWIEPGAAVSVTVKGHNLFPGTVRVGDIVLSDVQAVDDQTLQVSLPPSLRAGTYGVWVVNPGGQEGVLPGALRVGWLSYLPYVSARD